MTAAGQGRQDRRRALIESGLPAQRIERVAGRAQREPLLADDPASPQNRRISIVLLHQSATREEANEEARNDEVSSAP